MSWDEFNEIEYDIFEEIQDYLIDEYPNIELSFIAIALFQNFSDALIEYSGWTREELIELMEPSALSNETDGMTMN